LTAYRVRVSIPLTGWVIAGFRALARDGGFVMRSVFGRAVVVAGAVVVALGSASGAAAAKPRPPVLAFSPAPYNYGQVAAGQAASQTFTLANTGGRATGRLRVTLTGATAFTLTGETCHSLGPGKRCRVTVRFAPAGSGTVTATLTAAGTSKRAAATDALTGVGGVGAPPPSHLYWAAGDSIWEANLDGSSPQAIVTGAHAPSGVAVSVSHLYWTATAGDRGTIWQANLDGTSAAPIDIGDYNPAGVAVDASHLYWSDAGEPSVRQGAIWEANLDGTSPHAILTDQGLPFGVTVSASHLYWASAGFGTISQANLDGSSALAIVTGQISPFGVAVGNLLYWTDAGNGTINGANLDGSSPGAIVTGQHSPWGVAVGPN
jgi:hypothetical protein